MGLVVDGKWQVDEAYQADAKGAFVRPQSKFRNWITEYHTSSQKMALLNLPRHPLVGNFAACRSAYQAGR